MSNAYRAPAEIEADLEALISEADAAGKKPAPAKVGALRKELLGSYRAENAQLKAGAEPSLPHVEAPEAGGEPAGDEWAFIQSCCAEVRLANNGNHSGIYKKLYQEVVTRVVMWRLMREIFADVGEGGDLPTWQDLGLDAGSGKPLPPKSEPTPVKRETTPITEVTEAGMPVMAGAPSREQILAEHGGDPSASILAGTEPAPSMG